MEEVREPTGAAEVESTVNGEKTEEDAVASSIQDNGTEKAMKKRKRDEIGQQVRATRSMLNSINKTLTSTADRLERSTKGWRLGITTFFSVVR